MASETYEGRLGQPVKNIERTAEQFTQKILPGIFERTKESGHFQDSNTHKPISPSEMSDNIEEDSDIYQKFIKKLQNLLARAEKSPHLIGESDVQDVYRMFDLYGKGRGGDKTHYFVEYIKNKGSVLTAALKLALNGQITHERFARELKKILLELTGKALEPKKKTVSV